MPRIITERGLERNVCNPAFHTSKEDGTRVIGILRHSSDTSCEDVSKAKRRVRSGDIISPKGHCSTFHEYVVKLREEDPDSYYVMVHCSEDLNRQRKKGLK